MRFTLSSLKSSYINVLQVVIEQFSPVLTAEALQTDRMVEGLRLQPTSIHRYIGSGFATTLLLEVFIKLKETSNFNFIHKKRLIRFSSHHLAELGVTYVFHLQLAEKRVIAFLFATIERFSLDFYG